MRTVCSNVMTAPSLDVQSFHAYMVLWSVFQYLMVGRDDYDRHAIDFVSSVRGEIVSDIPNELWDAPFKEYMRETIEKRWSEHAQRQWDAQRCKRLHKMA